MGWYMSGAYSGFQVKYSTSANGEKKYKIAEIVQTL